MFLSSTKTILEIGLTLELKIKGSSFISFFRLFITSKISRDTVELLASIKLKS